MERDALQQTLRSVGHNWSAGQSPTNHDDAWPINNYITDISNRYIDKTRIEKRKTKVCGQKRAKSDTPLGYL